MQVESLQDKEKARHQGYNLFFGNSSVGAGLEYGKKDKAWVNKQTSIGDDEDKKTGREKYSNTDIRLIGNNKILDSKNDKEKEEE